MNCDVCHDTYVITCPRCEGDGVVFCGPNRQGQYVQCEHCERGGLDCPECVGHNEEND
jgi:hypothetical protein